VGAVAKAASRKLIRAGLSPWAGDGSGWRCIPGSLSTAALIQLYARAASLTGEEPALFISTGCGCLAAATVIATVIA
jgi:hypothetical protein